MRLTPLPSQPDNHIAMSAVITPAESSAEAPPFPVHRFTVEDYHRLVETGLLDEDARVELIEGWIVPKMTHSPLHDATLHAVQKLLSRLVSAKWEVRVQPAVVTPDSEPEPDIAVVQGPVSRYRDHHPTAGEISLIVEVADSSVAKDRRKASLYSSIEVPVYWIVNLQERCLEVREQPDELSRSYASTRTLRLGEAVNLIIGDQLVANIAVSDLIS
jgi:Uma2 family endonuclease